VLFVIVGVVLLGLHVADVGAVGQWPWWAVAAPFGLALVWWMLADYFGLTERAALRKFEAKRQKRRQKLMSLLGLGAPRAARASGGSAPVRADTAMPAAPLGAGLVSSGAPEAKTSKVRTEQDARPDFSDTVPSTIEVPPTLGRKEGARIG
jgi:small Trp-rich protein